MSYVKAKELEQLLRIDLKSNFNVSFTPPGRMIVNAPHNREIFRREFEYLKDFAEEHGFLFDEIEIFTLGVGTNHFYHIIDRSLSMSYPAAGIGWD